MALKFMCQMKPKREAFCTEKVSLMEQGMGGESRNKSFFMQLFKNLYEQFRWRLEVVNGESLGCETDEFPLEWRWDILS